MVPRARPHHTSALLFRPCGDIPVKFWESTIRSAQNLAVELGRGRGAMPKDDGSHCISGPPSTVLKLGIGPVTACLLTARVPNIPENSEPRKIAISTTSPTLGIPYSVAPCWRARSALPYLITIYRSQGIAVSFGRRCGWIYSNIY